MTKDILVGDKHPVAILPKETLGSTSHAKGLQTQSFINIIRIACIYKNCLYSVIAKLESGTVKNCHNYSGVAIRAMIIKIILL